MSSSVLSCIIPLLVESCKSVSILSVCFLIELLVSIQHWPSWSWLYDNLIYNYLVCNPCLSPLNLWVWNFESHSWQGVLTALCDKFISDLRQVIVFLCVFRFPPPIELTATEILLKAELNTIALTQYTMFLCFY